MLLFFSSSGKVPSSNIDLNSNFNGITVVFPHNLTILLDILSQKNLIGLLFHILTLITCWDIEWQSKN